MLEVNKCSDITCNNIPVFTTYPTWLLFDDLGVNIFNLFAGAFDATVKSVLMSDTGIQLLSKGNSLPLSSSVFFCFCVNKSS